MHPWHDISPGPKAPDIVHVIVEIPKGSRDKYELHKKTGIIKLDRVLFSSLHYPGDYGLIPQTFYDDGDPLDILVMTNAPTFPGCLLEARPIGLFRMTDRDLPDDKVLAVLQHDPFFDEYNDITDIPRHFLAEMEHFFSVYKDLELVRTQSLGWEPAAAARQAIRHAIRLYKKEYLQPKKTDE
jgi:inorganic pyrophosphatase